MRVYAYVIMTNHLHLILHSLTATLSDTIRDFKKFTARKIIETIETEPESRREWLLHRFSWNASHNKRNSNYQIWMQESHAIKIISKEFFSQKINYIHNNPVRASIVAFPEDYVYSSAYELSNRGNKIEITLW